MKFEPKYNKFSGNMNVGEDGAPRTGPVLPSTPLSVTNNQRAIDDWYANRNMFVPESSIQGTQWYIRQGLKPPPSAFEMDKRIANPQSPGSGAAKDIEESGASYTGPSGGTPSVSMSAFTSGSYYKDLKASQSASKPSSGPKGSVDMSEPTTTYGGFSPTSKPYNPTVPTLAPASAATGGFAPGTQAGIFEGKNNPTPGLPAALAGQQAQTNTGTGIGTSGPIGDQYAQALNTTVNAQAGSAMNQANLEAQMVPTLAANLQNKYNTVGDSVFGIQSSFFNPSEQMQNMYGQSQMGMAGQLSNRAIGAATQNANIASGGLYGAINDRAMRDLSYGSSLGMADTMHAQQSARAAAEARGLQFSPQGSNLEILNTYNLGATRLKERQAQANQAYGNAGQVQQMGYQSLLNPVLAESQKAGLYNQLTMTGNAMAQLMPNMLQPESQLYQNMYNQQMQQQNVGLAQQGIANSEAAATERTLGAAQISADAYAQAFGNQGGSVGGGGSVVSAGGVNATGSLNTGIFNGGGGGGGMVVGTGKGNPNLGISGGGMTLTVGGGQGGNKNQYVNNNASLGLVNDPTNPNSPNYNYANEYNQGIFNSNKTAGPINAKAKIITPTYNYQTLSPTSYGLTSGVYGGQQQYFDTNF